MMKFYPDNYGLPKRLLSLFLSGFFVSQALVASPDETPAGSSPIGKDVNSNGIGRAKIMGACNNPTDAGTLFLFVNSGAIPFDPDWINGTFPSGENGTLEYKWQSSETSGTAGFADIAGATGQDYNPGSLTKTTWFRRLAKVTCQADWTGAAVSNVLQVTVVTSVTWNGFFSDIWSESRNWTPNITPTSALDVVIPASSSTNYEPKLDWFATSTGPLFIKNLELQTGAKLNLDQYDISVTGQVANNGTIEGQFPIYSYGILIMKGSAAQTITGTGSIRNLQIDNSAGVQIAAGAGNMQSLMRSLKLTTGNLTTNGNLTLKSDLQLVLGARIEPHTTSTTISGTVIVERYITSGGSGRLNQWRCLGFPYNHPVSLSSLSGFSIDYASGSRSVMIYNEGADNGVYGASNSTRNAGYQSFTSSSDIIPTGRGIMAWLYGNSGGPAPASGSFTTDIIIQSSGTLNEDGNDVTLPVTYTSSNTNKGWNLVANPFVGNISWASPDIIKTNIDASIYRWEPGSQSWTVHNGISGTYMFGEVIESGGSFFVLANAPNPVLKIPQIAKTPQAPSSTTFSRIPRPQSGGQRTPSSVRPAGIRLSVKGQGNPLPETVYLDLSREDATPGFDHQYDAVSMGRTSGAGISIRDREQNGYAMQYDAPISETGIGQRHYALQVTSPSPGATTLEVWSDGAWNPFNTVSLIDTKEGKTILMKDGKLTYPFTMDGTKTADRFKLMINQVRLGDDGVSPQSEVKLLGNPVTISRLDLLITHPTSKPASWRILSMDGKEMGRGRFDANQTGIQYRILMPAVRNTGTYVINIEMDNGEKKSIQFIRQ